MHVTIPFTTSRPFRFDTDNPDVIEAVKQTARVCGVCDRALLYELPDKTGYALLIPPDFWQYGASTTYRAAIWSVLNTHYSSSITGRREDVIVVWTNSSRYGFGDSDELHVFVDHEQAYQDCAALWNWMCFILEMPVAEQRRQAHTMEFPKWVLSKSQLMLPTAPQIG